MVSLKVIPNQQSRLPALQVSAASGPTGSAGAWLWGRVGPEQSSAGGRAVLSQGCQDKGVPLSELLEGPVLCLHHCKQPCAGAVWVYLPKVHVGTRGWDV